MIEASGHASKLQSIFYRDKYRQILRGLLFLSALIVLLVCVIMYLVLFQAPPRYYATTTSGQIVPMTEIR